MVKLSEIVHPIWVRLHNAFVRRVNRLRRRTHIQHWQCGSYAGGIVSLGSMTESEAITRVNEIKSANDAILFIDFDRGFIAFGNPPKSL